MKKIIAIMAAAVVVAGLAGCSAKKAPDIEVVTPPAVLAATDVPEPTAEPTAAPEPTDIPEPTAEPTDTPVTDTPADDGVITVGTDAATIAEAVNMAKAGDVVFLPADTYTETVGIEKDGITLRGEEGTVFDGTGIDITDDNSVVIYVKGSDITVEGIEIKNFIIEGPSDYCPIGIQVAKGSSGVTVRNCKVHDHGFKYDYSTDDDNYNAHGIYVSGGVNRQTSDILVEGCELYNLHLGSSESLVFNGNVVGFEAVNNYIHDCDNIGIDAIGYEQDEDDDRDSAREGKIHGNYVANICSDPAVNPTYDSMCADGIYVDGGRDIEIFDNFVIGCDIGIEVASEHYGKVTSGINVHNNMLAYNNSWAGICIGGYDPDETGTAKGCTIKDNVVYNTDNYCLVVQYACDETNVIEGNIFAAEGDGI